MFSTAIEEFVYYQVLQIKHSYAYISNTMHENKTNILELLKGPTTALTRFHFVRPYMYIAALHENASAALSTKMTKQNSLVSGTTSGDFRLHL